MKTSGFDERDDDDQQDVEEDDKGEDGDKEDDVVNARSEGEAKKEYVAE
jgi:hypothetical protein